MPLPWHPRCRFRGRVRALLAAKREIEADVDDAVAAIIDDVAARGDAALDRLHQPLRPGRADARPLRLSPRRSRAAADKAPPETLAALRLAAERIEGFHRRQLPRRSRLCRRQPACGSARAGGRSPRVGLYVPGGTAAYPSSVLMNAMPAKVAGVERLVMVVPSPDGVLNPLVLAAAGAGRGRRDLSRRRRAGGRGAGLRHRDDRAGRQDRRARQRLCRGGQAARLRHGRHRHDRRPVRDPGGRRRAQRSRLDRRRSAVAGRARRRRRRPSSSPTMPRFRRRGRSARSPATCSACRGPRSPARAGATTARSSWSAIGTRRWR